MGGYWAYKTLGWGGYWGWDPVENTSLVPWIFTAALVHGMFLQRSSKRHRKVNLILACTAYATILYGTFLTRSGVLADFSVHSFIDLGITGWLVAILGTFVGALGPPDRVSLACDPGERRRGRGDAAPVAQRPLHPGHRGLLRPRPRDPPRHLRPAPDAPVGNAFAGADAFYGKTTTPAGFLLLALSGLVAFVSWKGATGKELFVSARRSLARRARRSWPWRSGSERASPAPSSCSSRRASRPT